ncbi:four helix bundle protein [Candidatus Saccharibacteria bacterium]|nr:four helix bundle protein [Candidatus Saccharibacteria bacterium]
MQHINQQHEERMLDFSVAVVRHCAKLKQPILKPITSQVIRSASSIGANFVEANNGSSKQDFRNKIFIAKKEANKTKYWLQMLQKLGDSTDELQCLLSEVQEFILILQKNHQYSKTQLTCCLLLVCW